MYARLDFISARLEWLGLTHRTYYHKMLQRIAGSATPAEYAALKTLTDVVEPMKDYTREKTAPAVPTSATPLNRVVDAVPPESDTARRFSETVDEYLGSFYCGDKELSKKLQDQLTAWAENDARLQPLMQRSSLAKELSLASRALSLSAQSGLSALASLDQRIYRRDEDTKSVLNTLKFLEDSASGAQLILAPGPAIEKLVKAAGTPGSCKIPLW